MGEVLAALPRQPALSAASLASITGLENVVSVQPYAFYLTGLTSFEWPAGATTVPEYAFMHERCTPR